MNKFKDDEWASTESITEFGGGFKLDLNAMIETAYKSRVTKPKITGIPIITNPLVPKGEIWCVNNKEDIYKIIGIGNSKLYRFILWWQKLVERIRNWIKNLRKN